MQGLAGSSIGSRSQERLGKRNPEPLGWNWDPSNNSSFLPGCWKRKTKRPPKSIKEQNGELLLGKNPPDALAPQASLRRRRLPLRPRRAAMKRCRDAQVALETKRNRESRPFLKVPFRNTKRTPHHFFGGCPKNKTYGHGSRLNHQELDRRFWSMFPLTRVPFWVSMFDPASICSHLEIISPVVIDSFSSQRGKQTNRSQMFSNRAFSISPLSITKRQYVQSSGLKKLQWVHEKPGENRAFCGCLTDRENAIAR